tara:strand:- start:1627 stop:1995 length:369 start_codon:yes stop_codon:yes gene_type:complete
MSTPPVQSMDIKEFLTKASPPNAEWRAYPLFIKNQELWIPFNKISMYGLIGKILVARDNVPNPCLLSHPYHDKQMYIMKAIERSSHFIEKAKNTGRNFMNVDAMPPLDFVDMAKLIEIINQH